MKQLHTQIEINAPKEKIWKILSDFEKYPDWNPFIRSIKGTLKKGSKLVAELHQPDSKPMTIQPKIISVKEGDGFSWQGHLLVNGIFDGHHHFELIKLETGKIVFTHREDFKGLLVSFLWKMLDTKTRKGFELMNEALKVEAEK